MAAIPEPLSAKFPGTFAYFTIKDRLPVILTKVIDALVREKDVIVEKYGKESREELKDVIGRLSKLKSDIQTDKPLSAIEDQREDSAAWNACIREDTERSGAPTSWFLSPWLLVECYMYRKIHEAFQLSSSLKTHDPFADQKELAFLKSLDAEVVLARHLQRTTQMQGGREEREDTKAEFKKFLQLDLWGNKCDLSISAGVENSQKTNPLDELAGLESYILADDSDRIWNRLRALAAAAAEDPNGAAAAVRVDFILDNAGFELFGDLCFADFLCSRNLVHRVVFHVKDVPWFVSDTTPSDLRWTLEKMRGFGGEDPTLTRCADRWTAWIESGVWRVKGHPFWTLPHDYSRMDLAAPDLHLELSRSDLLVFKGDLNYRKLTGDLNWETTTPFEVALRGFGPSDLCTLRTIKADVVVGLAPGQAEKTKSRQENWMVSGDFAVVQFAERRSSRSSPR